MASVSKERDVLVLKGLHDEVGDDSAVVGVHAGAIGVENAGDFDVDVVLGVVVGEEGFEQLWRRLCLL